MRPSTDPRLLRDQLWWSAEAQRLLVLLAAEGDHDRATVAAVAQAALTVLPPDGPAHAHRAALVRLLHTQGITVTE